MVACSNHLLPELQHQQSTPDQLIVSGFLSFSSNFHLILFQSVPGTGDKEKDEDKGMTIEEKKEAERQRYSVIEPSGRCTLQALALALIIDCQQMILIMSCTCLKSCQ